MHQNDKKVRDLEYNLTKCMASFIEKRANQSIVIEFTNNYHELYELAPAIAVKYWLEYEHHVIERAKNPYFTPHKDCKINFNLLENQLRLVR